MNSKELNRDDLLNRFASHTFTETTVGSMTLVEFKDGGSAVVGSSQKLDIGDAYREIREDLVGGAEVLLTITETQRDALTESIATGAHIYNTDATVEVYNSTAWDPV